MTDAQEHLGRHPERPGAPPARGGLIAGTDNRNGTQVVSSFGPLASRFGYVTDLRSMTQGRATSSMEFSHYAEVPKAVATELVQKSQA